MNTSKVDTIIMHVSLNSEVVFFKKVCFEMSQVKSIVPCGLDFVWSMSWSVLFLEKLVAPPTILI